MHFRPKTPIVFVLCGSCVLGCDKTRDDSDIGLFIPPLNCEVDNVDKEILK